MDDEHQARTEGDGVAPSPGTAAPRPRDAAPGDDGVDPSCPVRCLVEDVGRYLAGEDASPAAVGSAGRQALTRAAAEVRDLLRSAYAAHEVVATELRFAGPRQGFRRTVLASAPTPVALMLLAMRMCDPGDDITVLQHTAARGTSSRTARWPFPMDEAERLTRPPARDLDTPDGLADLGD
ncbi:MAG TPA: hypothetical protein VFW63_12625 [Acidimicrobiales bacterium]|nr:hypothetical protein [Acidimicrobiales bacterium]